MNSFPLLTILAVLPLVGAVVVAFLRGVSAKFIGLGFAITSAIVAVLAVIFSHNGNLAVQTPWIPTVGAYYALDIDGMASILVLLSVILVPAVMIAEWHVGDQQDARWSTGTFFSLALALEGFALFVFLAADALLFYVAFEATLIPMYFLIAGWGGARRIRAAVKFLLFSLAGGLIMLLGIAGLYAVTASQGRASFLFADLASADFSGAAGTWLFVSFFAAFAIKAPMAGLHSWLPDTTQQARPGASTLLVGILDKIGTFGMIKFCLFVFPEASQWAAPVILVWAIVSMLYGAFMALGATDLLRFVAYTSVSHFGFMVFGIFALTTQSITGAVFYMLAHGLSAAALFLVIGAMQKRRGSAAVDAFGGVQKVAPYLAGFFMMAGLSTLALPGMASFVGEFLAMAGAWQRHPIHTMVIALGMVMAAVYMLTKYQRTMTGPVTDQVAEHVHTDLNSFEKLAVAPLLVLLLVFGFFPKPILDLANSTATNAMSAAGLQDPTPQEGDR